MRSRSIRSLLVAAAVVLPAGGCSRPRAALPPPASSAAPLDLVATVEPYPPPGSEGAKADLAIVLWLQRTRTPDDTARARAEVVVDLETFAPALGRGFDTTAHPRTRGLLETFGERMRPIMDGAKNRFARPRPFDADGRVVPVVPRPRSFSYPSGHAMRGVLLARALAELAPSSRRAAIIETGLRVGYDRVVGGVHYPSDVVAGQRLGDALADALLADPQLHRELEAVRAAEWTAEAALRP